MGNNHVVAIIPARGNSKGIPKKNIKLLAGKPLIGYVINAAKQSSKIDEVYVSTEDELVAEISRLYGAKVINRPQALSGDEITLDPVILHALHVIEEESNLDYDLIVTIQPTSPLISVETIDSAIETLERGNHDTLISVKEDTHLYWMEQNGRYIPFFNERKNRQYLDPMFKETGALLISKREIIQTGKRIGDNVTLFKVPKEESIDIDTYEDWWTAEHIVKKLTIVIRTDGDNEIGLGHVYRALSLANQLSLNHDIVFLMNEDKKLGIRKVSEYNYQIKTFKDENTLFERLGEIKANIVLNDVLDTDKGYLLKLKERGYFVVNFEDLGEGSKHANLVINALYEHSYPPENHYYGYKYVCLRDEFYFFPRKEISKTVKNLLVTFGGTDPNNLTLRTLKAVEKSSLKAISINVILGLGYSQKEELKNFVQTLNGEGYTVNIKENIKMMAKEIKNADIVITSNGRTIYEVASIGTPCISISQNEREVRHLFVHNSRCIMNLGIAPNVSEDDIASAIEKLIDNYELREEMNAKMFKFDIKKGIDRVLRLIFDEYYVWRENEPKE